MHRYVHLGTCMDADCDPNADVQRRIQSAMTAFAPISISVLGRSSTSSQVRLRIASSLVLSRLLYNVHTWAVITEFVLQKLGGVYMRVLRRICGALRMLGNRISDAQVLWRLRAPRLVHLIRRNRLVYLASVLRAPACHLRALIAARKPDGSRQPWTEAVRADLVEL